MKLKYLPLACLVWLPALAGAQSVTLYGVVDTGIEFVNRIGADSDRVVRMNNLTASVPSRWGLRGTEDLGGGLKANFALESGFAPDSGVSNQGGRLFGRQAWVGLSGQWGQVALGRQYTMLFWALLDPDILGPNTFGSGSLDSYIPNARADNAVSYKGKFGGLTVGATYSFGRDTVNAGPSPSGSNCAGENPADRSACREWSALLMYETSQFGVSAAYDSIRGAPGAFGGLNTSGKSDDRLALSGYLLLPNTKVGAGWVRRDNDGSASRLSDLWYGGVAYDISPAFTLAGQVYYLKYRGSDNKAVLYALRGMYNLSKRTAVYATAGYIDNSGQLALSVSSGATGSNPVPGGSQLGAMVGVKHIF
ncbi:porin [Cupriavidus necator]|uniref:Porin n=1 Tax=Cupriavidus necator TaxID=106590 RepID=A0A367P9K5_CUPNE|nr:porin [Cupriavidus necator]QQX86037.1 porin [Cupriavidus necator]RCJ04549.1 porin [Cupriavidus necator]